MAATLPVHRHRSLSRLLLIHLILLVSQVVAFSWHGAYKSLPSSRSMGYSGWQPETFWWRSRRRSPSSQISVGDWLGLKKPQHHHHHNHHHPAVSEQSSEDNFLELDNSISNMPQPAYAAPRLQKERGGWGFFQQQNLAPHRVSLHYPSPAFSSPSSMNRRNRLDIVKEELDQEVMKNVIKQVLNKERHHRMKSPVKALKTPMVALPSVESQKMTTSAPAREGPASAILMPVPAHDQSITRHDSSSSPEGSALQDLASPSGFGEAFSDVQDSYSDFPNLGFGSFGEPAGFSDVVEQPAHEVPSQDGLGASFRQSDVDYFGGGGDHSPTGFGGFGKVAVAPFGWPQDGDGQGKTPADIEPIPTAIVTPVRSFPQEDKDCDTILTKSCEANSDCECYGFYFCENNRCHDITSTNDDTAAITFGETWHNGPAETLGLTERR